jgi:hypothetical protein
LASAASAFMNEGLYILGAVSYLACEIIGNCIISNETFDEAKCDQYARATCIVAFQVFFFWVAESMLFKTGVLSWYKVLVVEFSLYQWIGGTSFTMCLLISMVCYATKQNNGVPGYVLLVWCVFCVIAMVSMALSVKVHYEMKERLKQDKRVKVDVIAHLPSRGGRGLPTITSRPSIFKRKTNILAVKSQVQEIGIVAYLRKCTVILSVLCAELMPGIPWDYSR